MKPGPVHRRPFGPRIPCAVLVFTVLTLLGWVGPSHAQAPLREEPERVLGFAHQLLAEGDAYRAVTEYLAFLFLFPRHPRLVEARFFLGKAYQKEGQWSDAQRAFHEAALSGQGEGPWAREAAMELGETSLLAGQPEAAAHTFEEVSRFPGWRAVQGKALYRAAWCWMQSRRWENALRALDEIPSEDPLRPHAERLRAEIVEGLPQLSTRDPWLAAGLAALLPGSGHLYAGRTKDALTSFLLNGAFIAGAAVAIRKGYPITGGIMSFFELGWYLGGITTAAEGAERFNREQEARWLDSLGNRWGSSPGPGDHAEANAVVRWQWKF
jgi:tetratricopeptide (TPR) repeat protein